MRRCPAELGAGSKTRCRLARQAGAILAFAASWVQLLACSKRTKEALALAKGRGVKLGNRIAQPPPPLAHRRFKWTMRACDGIRDGRLDGRISAEHHHPSAGERNPRPGRVAFAGPGCHPSGRKSVRVPTVSVGSRLPLSAQTSRSFRRLRLSLIAYHAVTDGRMLVAADGVAPAEVRAGDILFAATSRASPPPGNTASASSPVYTTRSTGVTIERGWSRLSKAIQSFFASKPTNLNGTFEHGNHASSVHGDMAWVTRRSPSTPLALKATAPCREMVAQRHAQDRAAHPRAVR